MVYVGSKPSAVPLTSADITDGIITSAKIADGTIVNADINASAAIASTKLSGITSGLTKLVTSTPSSVATLDFTNTYITSTYNSYLIVGNLKPATDNVDLEIRFSSSSSFITSAGAYGWEAGDIGATQPIESDSDDSIIITRDGVGSDTGESISFMFFLKFPSDSNTKTSIAGLNNYSLIGNTHKGMTFSGFRNTAEANDGIRLFFASGNIASGSVTLYGLEK